MRLTIAAALLATAGGLAAAPAVFAGDYGIKYVGLRGSYVTTEEGSTRGTIDFDYDEEYEDGYGISGFVGWVVDNNFRAEVEAGYRTADVDTVTVVRDDTGGTTAGDVLAVDGSADVGTAMVNLFYDIHAGDLGFLPWIGVGVGGAYVDYSLTSPDLAIAASDTTWAFAYQLMAGVTFPIADGISMSAGYRFFQTEDFDYADPITTESFATDITQHSVDVGLQFHL
jgi:opacity protein-like surface antigen